jgi:hypothetical protein
LKTGAFGKVETLNPMSPMRFLLLLAVFFSGLGPALSLAEQIPFTNYPQRIILKAQDKNYRCPAWIKIRFVPEGERFRADFIFDSDLRAVYNDLVKLLGRLSLNETGESIRIYDISRRYRANQIIVKSKTDYRRDIVNDLQLQQTVESEVAFRPDYCDGVLRLNYQVLNAKLTGIADQLGLDARLVVQLVFDMLLSKDMQYRLFPKDNPFQVKMHTLAFSSKDNQFYGLQAKGSAWLTAQQRHSLVKQLTGQP